jgi:hypothetical protein
VVQGSTILVSLGFFITLIFGRSLFSVVQGTLGICMSLETYFAAARGRRWWLQLYAVYMLLSSVISVAYGAVVLLDVDVECSKMADQFNACVSTQVVYGLVIALGASSVGLFAAINTALLSWAMPAVHPADDSQSLLVH